MHVHCADRVRAPRDKSCHRALAGGKRDVTDAGGYRVGLIPIGIALALARALVGCGAQILLTFGLHGGVQHNADQLGQCVQSLLGYHPHQVIRYGTIGLAGHQVLLSWSSRQRQGYT